METLEEKYPEVAPYLGAKAISQVTQELIVIAGVQDKVMEQVMAKALELNCDQQKISQMALKLTYQLLLEEIDKMLAE